MKQRLLELLKERAFSFGNFKLASGKESTYYINSKKALFHSECAWLLGELLWDATKDLDINAIGGLEVGAIPMTAIAVQRYHQEGRELNGFFVRKQVKDHGNKELIECMLPSAARVAIVDDVLTTGASAEQAVQAVEQCGAKVIAVICIVDRLEGARERFASRYIYRPLYTINDFLKG